MKSAVVAAFTKREIDELCEEWQEELKIQDWDIDVAVVRCKSGILGSDDSGNCNFDEKRREATVFLVDPRDASRWLDIMRPYDMEVTLVHELMHCALAVFTGKEMDDREDVTQEQVIHTHSQLLVRLRRKAMPRRYAAFKGIVR